MRKAELEFRSRGAISKGVSQLRNHPLAHECHFAASYAHFAAAKIPPLQNPPPATETISKLKKWDVIFFFMFLFSFGQPNGYKVIFKLQNAYENAPDIKMGCETPLWL